MYLNRFLIVICVIALLTALPAGQAQAASAIDAVDAPQPAKAALITTGTLSAGNNHTCGVQSDNTLICWGAGVTNTGINPEFGQSIPPGGAFTQVSAGALHTCGVKGDGTVACWGYDYYGQATPPGGTFTQVSAGTFHTCGVKSDGTLDCWGTDDSGQASPPLSGTFTQVGSGSSHSCAIKSDGTVECWGWDDDGQATPPGGTFTQVSAGARHTCGLKTDGTVECWGAGTTNTGILPEYGQSMPPVGTFTQISAGGWNTCGVKTDGTLACWGANTAGQSIHPAGTFTQVSAGGAHACALRSDDTLICWGGNDAGQISLLTISGNVGIGAGTLTYDDGTFKTATADGSGNYSFKVPYDWSGVVTASLTNYGFTPASRPYSNVLAEQTGQDYTATLTGGPISGTIHASDGTTPLENIYVAASNNDFFAHTCTDANGDYMLNGLPFDTPLQIQVSPPWANCGGWSNYVQEFWQDAHNSSDADLLVLSDENPALTDIDFNLDAGGVISGTAYAADGITPLNHIAIGFEGANNYNNSVCTDASGNYEFHGAPFDLPLRIRADAYWDEWCNANANYLPEFWQETPDSGSASLVTVTALSPTQAGINFSLEAAGSVSGTVYAADGTTPIPNMVVSLNTDNYGNSACSDNLGHYTIHNVPFGLALRAQAAPTGGNWCNGSENYAPEFWQETLSSNSATQLTVTALSPNQTGIDFTLDLGGSISGTVYAVNGTTPLANIVVSISSDDYNKGMCTDNAGHYAFYGVPLGLQLRAQAAPGDNWCGGEPDYVEEFWQGTADWGAATLIVLTTPDPEATDIDFTLEQGGSVSGVVHAADGITPLPNMNVSLNGTTYGNGICTDASGQYVFHGVPLGQPLRVQAAGGGNWCGGAQDYVPELWQETPNWDDASLITLTSPSPDQTGIDFTLEQGGSISGVVHAADGTTPFPNVPVSINGDNYGDGICTDASGQYVFHGIPFGLQLRVQAAPGGNWCGGSEDYISEFWQQTPNWANATLISVTPPNPNQTDIDFSLDPSPAYIKANPGTETVHAYRWPSGAQVTISIDRPAYGSAVDYSDTATSGQASWDPANPDDLVAEFDLDGEFDLQTGDVITASGVGIIRVYTVTDLTSIRWFVGLGAGSDAGQILVEQQVVDDFNLSHADIELMLEVQPNASARATLADEIANGNAPDLVGPVGWAGSNAFHGQWLDLSSLIASTSYDTGQFNPALVNMYQTEEGQVGLPFGVYPGVVYYQKALFDAAGLHYPPANYGDQYEMPGGSMVEWNYDVLRQIARLLTLDGSGKNATEPGFDANNIVQYGYLPQWVDHPNKVGTLWGADSLYSGTPGNYIATIPAQWNAAWKWTYDGIWTAQPFIPTNQAKESAEFGYTNVFNSGKLAMAISQSWYLCCVADAGAQWELAALPAYNGQVHGRMDADTFRILDSSPHADEAFTVLTYLIGDASAPLLQAYSGMGARTAAQNSWLAEKEAQYPFVNNWEIIKDGLDYPDAPNAESWMPHYDTAWDRLQSFADHIGSTPGLNMDNEIADLRADLESIFNDGHIPYTPTPTVTATTTQTATITATATPTLTPTATQTKTPTLTATQTLTSTPTVTKTPTGTITLTATTTNTATLTATVTPTPLPITQTFSSAAAQDGWVLESAENSNAGGTLNAAAVTFQLGDDAANRQYRVILSFNTAALPDGATIQSALLKIRPSGTPVGVNPFNVLGKLWADIRQGPFGTAALQLADFNTAASATQVGAFNKTPVGGWYTNNLNATGLSKINKIGLTQLRLYFAIDDNNNRAANFMKFVSGNGIASQRPVLIIQYRP